MNVKTVTWWLAFLTLIGGWQAAVAQPTAVSFAPSDDGWAVLSEARGTAQAVDGFVRVTLDQFALRYGQTDDPDVTVRRYKIGLAYGKSGGGWTVDRWSDPVAFSAMLKAGERIDVGASDVLIDATGLTALDNYWLVLAVEVESNRVITLCYAHNRDGRWARS
jgi:hypothetical protein